MEQLLSWNSLTVQLGLAADDDVWMGVFIVVKVDTMCCVVLIPVLRELKRKQESTQWKLKIKKKPKAMKIKKNLYHNIEEDRGA